MNKQNISKKILYWYDNNKRILPWRKNVSKKQKQYFTLISEFMLQQTQVKTVIPYFINFINNIPNLESLAKVNNRKLMKCWVGLGYYSRARNLLLSCSNFILYRCNLSRAFFKSKVARSVAEISGFFFVVVVVVVALLSLLLLLCHRSLCGLCVFL